MASDVLAKGRTKAFGGDWKQFDSFLDKMLDGFAYHKIVFDKAGKPVDYVFLEVNSAFEKMMGLKREQIIGRKVTEVLPGIEKDPADWIYGKVALTGEPVRFENHAIPLDKWYRVSAYCPEKGYLVALFEDITEHKKAEASLKETKNQLELQFKRMPIGCIVWDKDFKVISWNPAAESIFGYSVKDIIGKHPYGTVVPKEAQPIVEKIWRRLLEGDETANSVNDNLTKDGKVITCSWSNTPLKREDNSVIGVLSMVQDITERKKGEEEIERLASFPTINPSPIVEIDFEGNIEYLNPVAKTIFADLEILGLKHPFFADVKSAIKIFKENKSSGFVSEVKIGEDWYLQQYFNVPKTHCIRIYALNITERKKAEEALRESEQRWATTLASIGDAVIATDVCGNIVFMNGEAEELTGWMLTEASQKSVKEVFNIVNEQTRLEVESPIERVLREGMVVGLANHTVLIRKDGKEVAIDDSGAPIKDKKGKISGVVLVFRDITERKIIEEKLEEYRNSLEILVEERTKKLKLSSLYARNLIEASLDPLVTINVEGKITDVNKATELATGRSRKHLIGSDFSNYFIEPEKAKIGYKLVFTEGLVKDYPLAIRHKNGSITDVLYNATVYRNEAGEIQGVFAAARDITELRKAEEEAQEAAKKLKDSERLAAIGATAGMVGHDIRNPLQAIIGDVYLAKTELASIPESDEKSGTLESLEGIEKNIDYINKIVADLQDFARPLNPHTEEADLKLIIEDLLKKNGLPENIKVTFKIEAEDRKVMADCSYINRIMYNLVNNAVQAMPNGGKLTIHVFKEENDTIITVKDTGVGIPEKVKGKLFTPMFTTKSKGQGFGLPVVKRMTEALGGRVTFESKEAKGTTFIIHLPSQPAKR